MEKKISVIVPVYNEEENIPLFYNALYSIFAERDYELIFINDGSKDNSKKAIEELVKKDARIKFIEFSKNFGKEAATSAGLAHAKGDAAIMIDADLQHPIELIPDFIKEWEKGVDVVVGIRRENQREGLIKKYGSVLFYKIMNFIGDTEITPRATDFRLIDRVVIDQFNKFTEHGRMTRGLIDWLGFSRAYIPFVANERKYGKASYTYAKLIKLALSSFVSYSLFPLKLAGYLGVFIILTSGSFGLFMLVEDIILDDPLRLHFSSIAMLAMLILFLVGVVLACLGLIALYVANIHREVMARPLYVVRRTNIENNNK